MITQIQSLGKYHRALLGTLLGITIVSFVFFGAWSDAGGRAREKRYLGVNLNDERAREPYWDLAILSNLLRGRAETIEHFILLLHLADNAQIPAPTGNALHDEVVKLFGSEDALAKTLPTLTDNARRHLGVRDNATATARLERFFANTSRIQKLTDTLRGPGFALPYEATLQWRLENTKWEIETANLPSTTFNPQINPTDADLATYFEQNKETFRTPPVVTASYALFAPTAADAKDVPADTDDATLRAFLFNNDKTLNIPGLDLTRLDDQFKTRRPDFLRAWRDARIRDNLAGRLSNLLVEQLPFDEPATEERLKKFLDANTATEVPLPPFHRNDIPANLPIPTGLLGNIFELTTETWHSNVFPLAGKGVIFFHKKTAESRIPDLAEVREKVTAAYREKERASLFSRHSLDVEKKLKEAVATGKTFADAAKQNGLTVETLPAFTTRETPPALYGIENPDYKPGALPDGLPALVRYLGKLPDGGITPVLRRPGTFASASGTDAGNSTGSGNIGSGNTNTGDAVYIRLVKKTEPIADEKSKEIQDILANTASTAAHVSFDGVRTPTFRLRGLLDDLAPPAPAPAENAEL
jgi:hypothetical protein